jgi:hypothetical protein
MKRYVVMTGMFLFCAAGCVPADGMRQTGAGLLAATGLVSQNQASTLIDATS